MADQSSHEPAAGESGRRRGVAVWWITIVTAVVTAVTVGVVTAVLVPRLSEPANDLLDDVLADGEYVGIHVVAEPSQDDVSIPSSEELSDDELADLYEMTPQAATTWLSEHKDGTITSTRTLTLTLTGREADPIRITGVDTVSDCKEPDRGTLVRMVSGRGAGVASERMTIKSEDADARPLVYDASGNASPYFPDRTIELAKDEEVVVVVDLEPSFDGLEDPDRVRVCDVHLSLRLLKEGEELTVAVPHTIRTMGIEPDSVEDLYQQAYLGPGLCDSPSIARSGWASRGPSECG
ncbi:hypothetical protein MRBLMI12_002439 [Microbacterium sp. LMI12-1-1.1]|uniref:hypothetical protein n=1 Tax=Microbacterium sp. LMI12-1-1.1 TaxID=3135225 RepID=UPI00344441D1